MSVYALRANASRSAGMKGLSFTNIKCRDGIFTRLLCIIHRLEIERIEVRWIS